MAIKHLTPEQFLEANAETEAEITQLHDALSKNLDAMLKEFTPRTYLCEHMTHIKDTLMSFVERANMDEVEQKTLLCSLMAVGSFIRIACPKDTDKELFTRKMKAEYACALKGGIDRLKEEYTLVMTLVALLGDK